VRSVARGLVRDILRIGVSISWHGAEAKMMRTLSPFVLPLIGLLSACEHSVSECSCGAAVTSLSPQADIFARIVSASADTCSADLDTALGVVTVSSQTHQPCHVRIHLDDGRVEQSTVTFTRFDACCGALFTLQGTDFAPVDGGAD
jgi:hypothetical protein